MKSFLRLLALCLALALPALAVTVTSNTSVNVPTLPGYPYKFQALGTWGGATVTLQTLADGNWTNLPSSSYTADFETVKVSSSREMRALVTGASGSTSLSIVLSEVRPGDVILESGGGGGGAGNDLTSGPVTSANGVSAIADGALTVAKTNGLQPALDSKSTATNYPNLQGLQNTISQVGISGDAPISIMVLGDSFASGVLDFSGGSRAAGSYRCGGVSAAPDTGVTLLSDYTKVPDGRLFQIASGGLMHVGHAQTGVQGPATHIYYTLFPGAGTVQFQISDNGGAWTNVGAAINTTTVTDVLVGSVALSTYSSQIRSRMSVTVGNVFGYMGQGIDGPGITSIYWATTGQAVENCATINEQVWKKMCIGYRTAGNPQIIFSAFADHRFTAVTTAAWPTKGTPSWGASGPAQTLYNWSRVANPTVDWFVIGPHTVDPARVDPVDTPVDNAFAAIGVSNSVNARIIDGSKAQREFAERNAIGFVDCTLLYPDYAKAVAEGNYTDDIHLNTKGQTYKRSFVWNNSNIGWVLGAVGYNSGIRLGNAKLAAGRIRVGGFTPVIVSNNAETGLEPILAAQLRAGLAGRSETEGIALRMASSNVGRIELYNTGSITPLLRFETGAFAPVTSGAMSSGAGDSSWSTTYTNGLKLGYVEKTANYSITPGTSQDYLINCISGTFTVTLPACFSGQATGMGGRCYIIKNTGTGTITVATTLDSGLPQFIDGATSATLTQGQTLRVMATGNLPSVAWRNWVTF